MTHIITQKAAQELLKTCEFVRECLEPLHPSDHIMMKYLNNAITKARGE